MFKLPLTSQQAWELRELTRTAPGRVAFRALMVLWRAEGLTTLESVNGGIVIATRCLSGSSGFNPSASPASMTRPAPVARPKLDPPNSRTRGSRLGPTAPRRADSPAPAGRYPATVYLPWRQLTPRSRLDTLRQTVHALGFRWRRPRLWARQAEPRTSSQKQLLGSSLGSKPKSPLPPGPPGAAPPVHFLVPADASDHHLLVVDISASRWMRRGQQVRVATPPHNGRWTLFGGLNVHRPPYTGTFHWQAYRRR